MARTLLPVVGGAIGFMVGGPTGAQIGFTLGSVVGSLVDPVTVRGPQIGETGTQTSAEGAPRAIVYGTAPVTGNVIASGDLVRQWVSSGGGKGGAPKQETEHVYRTFAIRICEGSIAGILRVWEDDKLVYDVRPESTIHPDSAKWISNKTIYHGGELQLPDPVLQAQVSGIDDTPAYRGTAYVVIDSEDLTDRRGSIPQYRFEVSTSLAQSSLPSVQISPIDGQFGGGTFSTGYQRSIYLDDAAAGPGEVWLVFMAFYKPGGTLFSIPCYVLIDSVAVWSDTVTVGDQVIQYAFTSCQINHPASHTEITYGFGPNSAGSMQIGISFLRLAPSGMHRAYPGANLPQMYPSDHPYFGVVIGPNGTLYAPEDAEAPNNTVIPWGADSFQENVPLPVPLHDIVIDVADRCTLPAALLDVAELTDTVSGLVLAGEYTGADAIDVLRRAYFFDRSEHGGRVRFLKRGKAVVDVLTVDDLVEDPDTSTREQAGEYPAKLHLFYQHAASGYARVKATAQRSSSDVRVVGEVSFEVPVVLDEDEAARSAHKMHKVSWADAEGEVKISLPESFVRLAAADSIGLSLRDRVRRLRIEELQLADGRLHLTTRVDRQSAYTSAVTGIPLPAPTRPPGTIVGATVLVVLDIPSRLDSEDDLNLYYAVSAVEPAWYGALVERSRDAGATFADAAQIERAMVVGVLTADLPAASEHYTDTTNRVRLRLYRGSQDLESITEQAFLSGGGAFAVQGPGGGWEILQYLDADDLGDQEYELSTLHRGRLATQTDAHPAGSVVVFLDDVEHAAAQAAWIGQSLTHRATSFGATSESSAEQTAAYEGRSQIEWPVAYLTLERDGLDVIRGAWTPRHRFGSDDAPVASINFEGYRVTIDDGSTAIVIDTDQPHFTHDASALAAPVTVSVAARNRITGAGPATSDSV